MSERVNQSVRLAQLDYQGLGSETAAASRLRLRGKLSLSTADNYCRM